MTKNNNNLHFAFMHVNYDNSQLTINCINSILGCNYNSTILIVDNNSDKSEKKKLTDWQSRQQSQRNQVVFLFEPQNLGYFGALNVGLKYLKKDIQSFDFITIGNNDLLFDESYFETLMNTEITAYTYVLAPNIIKTNGIHQNPYSINGTSKTRKLLYYILYSNYRIAKLIYLVTAILNIGKSDKDRKEYEKSQFIFAGHGACYVLTKSYFNNNFFLVNSSFLMGEEFLFAKQIRESGGKIYYLSTLCVIHNEHSTMNKIPSKAVYKYEQSAFKLTKNIC